MRTDRPRGSNSNSYTTECVPLTHIFAEAVEKSLDHSETQEGKNVLGKVFWGGSTLAVCGSSD